MPIFHRNILQNDAKWYRIRAGKVTASAIDQVLTPAKLDKSASSKKYLNHLLAEQMMGRPEFGNPYRSDAMEYGQENEQAAADAFAFQHQLELEEIGFVERNDRKVGASPDRLVIGRDEGLELKSPTPSVQMGYVRNSDVLVKEYFMQVQFQMYVCDFGAVWLYSHHAGLPAVTRRVLRDSDYIDKMMPGLNLFLAELAEERAKLEAGHGPFPELWKPDLEPKQVEGEDPIYAGMGVTEEDIDFMLKEK